MFRSPLTRTWLLAFRFVKKCLTRTEQKWIVQVGGSVAYVPQTAWIMNESVRENVLMGDKLEERRYVPCDLYFIELKANSKAPSTSYL